MPQQDGMQFRVYEQLAGHEEIMSLCVQFSRGPQGTDFRVLLFDYYQTYQHGSPDWWWLSQWPPQAATGHLPSISSQYQLPCQML